MNLCAIFLLSMLTVAHGYGFDFPNNYYGSYRFPPGCKSDHCKYEAEWEYIKRSDSVKFSVTAEVPRGYWAGIGISEDKLMPSSDCITGSISRYGKDFKITDRFLVMRNRFSVPADKKQNVYVVSKEYSNGRLKFSFIRERDTWDDDDISLTRCRHLLFAWGGEAGIGDEIYTHTQAFASKRICIGPIEEVCPRPSCMIGGGGADDYSGHYRVPEGCSGEQCEYQAYWKYYAKSDSVQVTVEARVGKGYWVGFGISENRLMPASDCIVGYLDKSGDQFRLVDRYLIQRKPDKVPVDDQQDAKLISYKYNHGFLKFSFLRRRYTKDKYDLPLTVCRHLLFAWGGKAFDDYKISQHKMAFSSGRRVCIGPVKDKSRVHTDGDYRYSAYSAGSSGYHKPPGADGGYHGASHSGYGGGRYGI